MKIVFDARVHLNYFSGISRYIICLLEAYLRMFPDDHVTVLINPSIKSDNSLIKSLAHFSNLNFLKINTAHMGPKNYLVMGRIIRKLKPDIYHYPHLDAPVFIGKTPLVATIHDTNSNKKIKKFNDVFGLKSIYFKKALSLTLKKAKVVLFVSDSIKNEVLADTDYNLNDNRFVRIYNGLEEKFNRISDSEISMNLMELELELPYFLYVGQIRIHKNVDRIIQAFELFSKKNRDYKLVLVGHNYLEKNLKTESILHFDSVSESQLKSLYASCSALVFPSLFEGFGFPILEAFSFGKPVITSDYGATAEISGGLANLVNPLETEEISNAMNEVISGDSNAEKRILHAAKFNWTDHAIRLREVYKSCLD